MSTPEFRLLIITDRRLVDDLPAAVGSALEGAPPGRAAVMLREKDLGGAALLELGRALIPVCRAAGAPLLVNDRVDVARALDADGVHLPADGLQVEDARSLLGQGALVGVSAHCAQEVADATAAGADYVCFGPLFDTPSKRGFGPPLGLAALDALDTSIPLFALGGLDPTRARAARGRGAYGVACIRAVLGAADPAAAVATFLEG